MFPFGRQSSVLTWWYKQLLVSCYFMSRPIFLGACTHCMIFFNLPFSRNSTEGWLHAPTIQIWNCVSKLKIWLEITSDSYFHQPLKVKNFIKYIWYIYWTEWFHFTFSIFLKKIVSYLLYYLRAKIRTLMFLNFPFPKEEKETPSPDKTGWTPLRMMEMARKGARSETASATVVPPVKT